MNAELRERAVLPILIPLAAILLTEVIVFSMSQVLLASGKDLAVVIAIGAALAILIGAAFIAARPRIKTQAILGLLAVLFLASVAAGAVAMKKGPAYLAEEAANRPKLEVSANNLVFDTKTLELGTSGTIIDFVNADAQPHNIAIYLSETALDTPFFKGALVPAGGKAMYEVEPIEVGSVYYFQCDVHPTMNGKAFAPENDDPMILEK